MNNSEKSNEAIHQNPPERLGVTPSEFAKLFGRHATWGYRKLYSGEVRRLDSPGLILIPMSEVRRFASRIVEHGHMLGED